MSKLKTRFDDFIEAERTHYSPAFKFTRPVFMALIAWMTSALVISSMALDGNLETAILYRFYLFAGTVAVAGVLLFSSVCVWQEHGNANGLIFFLDSIGVFIGYAVMEKIQFSETLHIGKLAYYTIGSFLVGLVLSRTINEECRKVIEDDNRVKR